ncbi:DUF397 domain-containing protein [Streptomyces sp. Z26]|uniref:DUF397 domain-containing protein n=1 Tax=Streptomyces sp. Z26 TaxID=2500177 RepID=UPI000EF16365|nr:DUF397 domain-containing protein [Streptomyces sp. Z26]RLL66046.1 DUF397 domain-containing protein [Streptomyces sp. Z26]
MTGEAAAGISAELVWFKSSYSGGEGGECVEVAATDYGVCVRDSKDVSRSHLSTPGVSWSHFVRYAAGG